MEGDRGPPASTFYPWPSTWTNKPPRGAPRPAAYIAARARQGQAMMPAGVRELTAIAQQFYDGTSVFSLLDVER